MKKLITLFNIIFWGLASCGALAYMFKEENIYIKISWLIMAITCSCIATGNVHKLINLLGKKAKK